MLVLTRKLGERIVIDENVVVEVLEVHKGRVKLGISAPMNVPVHREETARSIEAGRQTKEYAWNT